MSLANIFSKCKKASCEYSISVYSFESPLGRIIAAADDDYLYIVTFEDSKNVEKKFMVLHKELPYNFIEEKNKLLQRFEEEMTSYFEGNLKKFTIPLKMIGSNFQKLVWEKLLELPYGQTRTYGDLAKTIGRPASHARAVGAACGANGHLLVVPCHRVIASSANGGYNSGVDRKEKLITHEKKYS